MYYAQSMSAYIIKHFNLCKFRRLQLYFFIEYLKPCYIAVGISRIYMVWFIYNLMLVSCWFISDLLYVFYARSVTGLPLLPEMLLLISHRRPFPSALGPGVIAWLVRWSTGVPVSPNCYIICPLAKAFLVSHWSTRC